MQKLEKQLRWTGNKVGGEQSNGLVMQAQPQAMEDASADDKSLSLYRQDSLHRVAGFQYFLLRCCTPEALIAQVMAKVKGLGKLPFPMRSTQCGGICGLRFSFCISEAGKYTFY